MVFRHGFEDESTVLFQQDLNAAPVGVIDATLLGSLFNSPTWNNGVDDGRVAIVEDGSAERGRVLEIAFPDNTFGPSQGGAQWRVRFPGSHDEVYLAYWVKFGAGFDFVRGGKLPGLVGGTANTGGDKPDGTDGWSARMMWREAGAVVQYVYHPDQPGIYGEDMPWNHGAGGQRFFAPGVWHRVVHRVVMNTPGQNDGMIEGWFDGELAFREPGIRFRDVNSFAIDELYFSTFFGGGSQDWASTADETLSFDDFVIWIGANPN